MVTYERKLALSKKGLEKRIRRAMNLKPCTFSWFRAHVLSCMLSYYRIWWVLSGIVITSFEKKLVNLHFAGLYKRVYGHIVLCLLFQLVCSVIVAFSGPVCYSQFPRFVPTFASPCLFYLLGAVIFEMYIKQTINTIIVVNEPQRQKTHLLTCTSNDDSNQSAHAHSRIRVFVFCKQETLHPWLSKMCPVKILIRLRKCAVWSESSLGASIGRYVFWRCG